jgi:hypothetical protein
MRSTKEHSTGLDSGFFSSYSLFCTFDFRNEVSHINFIDKKKRVTPVFDAVEG